MRAAMLLMVSVVLAGCFDPRFKDDLRCDADGACPPGFTCGLDDFCRAGGPPPDALVIPDAAPVVCTSNADCETPPNPCLQAGVCDLDAGVCDFLEVDCSAFDSECAIGMCEPSTGACFAAGANEGVSCGAGVVCGAFDACAGFADGVCDSSGEQHRDCTRNTCADGACVADAYVETAACTRITDGVDCDTDTVAGCGACGGFGTTCGESGTQTCDCTDFKCQSDACVPSTSSCVQGCSRDTDGISCGSMTVTGCTTCGYTSVCDELASDRTCTCTTFSCVAGGCSGSGSSCQQPCTRTTDGDDCGCLTCGPGGEQTRFAVCNASGGCVGTGVCGACDF